MTESGELLTLHRQGSGFRPRRMGASPRCNLMRYAVDYAAMNDHRLWHKVFVSGVSRLNSHSVIVYVLRRLRILTACRCMDATRGGNRVLATGIGGKRSAACRITPVSSLFSGRAQLALRPTGGTGCKGPD